MTKDEKKYIKGIVASGGSYTNTIRESYKPSLAIKTVKITDPFGKGERRHIRILGVTIF